MPRRIIDISPRITPDLAVFPGDTTPRRELLMDMRRGDPLTLSTLRSTVHLGAHIDGPNHYGTDAPAVDSIPLQRCIGTCRVVHVDVGGSARLTAGDISDPIDESRILLRTNSFPDPTQWTGDFAALSPQLVDDLHDRGVVLVGVDTPSVDTADSKDLPAHHRFLAHDMTILEGLVLTDVPPGRYELIALPLALVGFDASPVRAVLRELE